MTSLEDWDEPLAKASLKADKALDIAISSEFSGHAMLHRETWATAHIIHCDVIRLMWAMQGCTRQGLARLLWMGEVISCLYEAKKWYCGAGRNRLVTIAEEAGIDGNQVNSWIREIHSRAGSLRMLKHFEYYRNTVGHHYDQDLIGSLERFSSERWEDFEEVVSAYAQYAKEWMRLCERVIGRLS